MRPGHHRGRREQRLHELRSGLDVRTILCVLLLATVVSYTVGMAAHVVLTGALFALMVALGDGRAGLKLALTYAVALGGLGIELRLGFAVPPPMVLTLVYKVVPVVMPFHLLLSFPSAKLTLGLRQLPLPRRVQLTLVVMLRFAPTVAHEASDVYDAMCTRGFLSSPLTVLRRPLDTLEYVIVPLVLRELTVADELAAAVIVRGIDSPCVKHGYYVNRMGGREVILVCASVVLCACLILLPGRLGG